MKSKLFLLTVIIIFAGCAPQKMYYFGDYSKSLYSLEKNQTDEMLGKHQQELERIVLESETRNLPVPPGIYAELGYIHLKTNNSKEAVRLFQTESRLFPESKPLMDRLVQNAKARDNSESTDPEMSISKNTVSEE